MNILGLEKSGIMNEFLMIIIQQELIGITRVINNE